jgi:hypothetical protein
MRDLRKGEGRTGAVCDDHGVKAGGPTAAARQILHEVLA